MQPNRAVHLARNGDDNASKQVHDEKFSEHIFQCFICRMLCLVLLHLTLRKYANSSGEHCLTPKNCVCVLRRGGGGWGDTKKFIVITLLVVRLSYAGQYSLSEA